MQHIVDLPLFPLDTVLFPGMALPLHIFEPRYKEMIGQCLETGQPFGVVLIRRGQESGAPLPQPYGVGCTAKIIQVDPLDDGNLNILVLGRDRFRILSLEREPHPYLTAQVERLTYTNLRPEEILSRTRRLAPWVRRYAEILAEIDGVDFDPSTLPHAPLPLALTAAALLQISSWEKQPLLEEDSAALLEALLQLYRREVTLAVAMLERDLPPALGIFSLS
jgi:Lon protease-like protein